MKHSKFYLAAAAAVAVLSLGVTTFATADSVNPTQQEALDGLAVVKKYIEQHPDAPLPTTPPATTTAAPTTTAPSTDPANFVAAAGDQKIVLTWAKPLGGTPTGYIYGRNGVDNTGYGAYTSPALPATTFSVTLDKLINGTAYTVFVEAVYPSGNKRVSLTRTPAVVTPPTTIPPTTTSPPPTTTTAAPTTTPPVVGARLSGLPWNSGVWTNQDVTRSNNFITNVRGGRNLDNYLVYTWRDSQAAQNQPSAWLEALPSNFNAAKQDLVLAVTTWTADGAFTTGAQGQALGTSICGIDSNAVVRLDWEMNLADGAGSNGAALTASNYNAWVARFRAVATGLKTTCPGIRIDFNPNHGADQTAGCNTGAATTCSRRAFQALKDVVDIFGIDRYDSFPPVLANNSGWTSHLNGFNELDESRTYALANGKKWSLPEWGLWTASNSGGGDDPKYIQNYFAYFNSHSGDIAYETYFDEPASYIVSTLLDANPNGRAAYKAAILAS